VTSVGRGSSNDTPIPIHDRSITAGSWCVAVEPQSVCGAAWLADLGAHGLLRGSLVPPQPIRELRDLTRARTALTRDPSLQVQRIEKVLEDSGGAASDRSRGAAAHPPDRAAGRWPTRSIVKWLRSGGPVYPVLQLIEIADWAST
jgi:hypothetical protein